ncbi:hypothetical protein EON65_49440 [archaeon]|nr:MAG: hypothetical protein EON65_49440 [archaeon]
MSHISWKLKTFSQNSSIQCESSLFFHGILTEEMKTLAFSQFVQAIPILSELSFQSHFEILSSHFLHEALSTKHSVNVTRISLYLDCLENFEQLSNIVALCQNLRHLTLNVVCKGQIRCPHIDFFVNMVCKHCSNLCTLSLTDLINIDNTHVTIMVDRLPTLHTVLLPSGAHKVDRSTLFHMAQTQRQWEHLNLWGTAVDVKDIVQALELHHLQVKKLEHKYEGGLCSVGYGRVNMRIVDVIASIF